MFDEKLHVGRPNILDPEALYARVQDAVDRKWLTNDGPFVLELERDLARFLGVKHCVAVANATLGLQLLVNALGIRGKVLMPSGMHPPMPVTDRLVETIFQLPTGLQLDEADAFAIGTCVALWLQLEQGSEPGSSPRHLATTHAQT